MNAEELDRERFAVLRERCEHGQLGGVLSAIEAIQSPAVRMKALQAVGVAQGELGLDRDSEETFAAAVRLARENTWGDAERSDRVERAVYLHDIADAQWQLLDRTGARRTLKVFLEVASAIPEPRPVLQRQIAVAFARCGEFQRGFAVATQMTPSENRVIALALIGDAQAHNGDLNTARAVVAQADTEAGQLGGGPQSRSYWRVARAQARVGNVEKAWATVEKMTYDYDQPKSLTEVAEVQAEADDLAGALETARRCIRWPEDYTLCLRGVSRALPLPDAEAWSQLSGAVAGIDSRRLRVKGYVDLAFVQVLRGYDVAARATLNTAETEAQGIRAGYRRDQALIRVVRVWERLGDAKRVAQLVDRIEDPNIQGVVLEKMSGRSGRQVPRFQGSVPARLTWPQFRGPTGIGLAPAREVPQTWNRLKNLLWHVPLPGTGASSPCVWGDWLFLTASLDRGENVVLLCLNAQTGETRWERLAVSGDPGPTHDLNMHASSTPATDGVRVYSFFGKLGFTAYDYFGRRLWRRDLGDFNSIWGTAASPIVYKDLVIINCDQDTLQERSATAGLESRAFIIALDKYTGKTVWRTPRHGRRGWSTTVVVKTRAGYDEIVLNGPDGVNAYHPLTGKRLWWCSRDITYGTPTVVYSSGHVFSLAGRSGAFFAVRPGGRGDVRDTHVNWNLHRNSRDISSPVVWRNVLYTINLNGIMTWYNTENGSELGKMRFVKGCVASPTVIGGLIYALGRDGEMVVFEPGPKPKVVSRNRVVPEDSDEDFKASPAVIDGRLFVRSTRALYCIGRK